MKKDEYLTDTFGGKLATLRIVRKLSQATVASVANISTGYYSALENDKRLPPPNDTLTRILKALNCTRSEVEDIQQLAATERRIIPMELELPAELQALIVELRTHGKKLSNRSVHALRAYIRDALS